MVRPPLLAVGGGEGPKIRVSPFWGAGDAANQASDPDAPDPFKELENEKRASSSPVSVPATLRTPHPIVSDWLTEDEKDRARWAGISSLRGYQPTSIYGAPIAKRRLRILSALFRTREARGFVIEQDRVCRTEVWARFGHSVVKFALSERILQKRQKVQPPRDLAATAGSSGGLKHASRLAN